jgi:hypothetical protein
MRRWSIGLNISLSTLAVLALVTMVNYLASRHFTRFAVAAGSQVEFSPITKRTLESLTNDVKIIVYFDKSEPLYDAVWSLLKEYKFSSPHISIETVDYLREAGAAELIKSRYKLAWGSDNPKDLIIFDCNGSRRIIFDNELSELDLKPLMSGQSREIRRTHFKGEMLFTSALQRVTSGRTLTAYFLQGDGEHSPESDERLTGYAKFAGVLKENNVSYRLLTLRGTVHIPVDCNLLIIAGPLNPLLNEDIEKIDRYLKQGGRMLVLFRYKSLERPTGLEKLLQEWGIAVGRDLVVDPENFVNDDNDIVLNDFSDHPLTKPLQAKAKVYMILPRSIGKVSTAASGGDGPVVQALASTGPNGRVITDIQPGPTMHKQADDFVGRVPVMAALEKGTIRGLSADRGSTRMVVLGDSIFLANGAITVAANYDFANYAINWLLARNELLVGLAPRPIKEYKLAMTQSQRHTVSWILLGGMPGSVLLLGTLVWFRRRR